MHTGFDNAMTVSLGGQLEERNQANALKGHCCINSDEARNSTDAESDSAGKGLTRPGC